MAALFLLLVLLLLQEVPAQRLRAPPLRVRISVSGDSVELRFLRSGPDVALEGFVLGYGGGVFSRQFVSLPEDGDTYETELDAEPKYLVAVQQVPVDNMKKDCTGKVELEKPLHLSLSSVSPTAVLLSWGGHLKAGRGEGDIRSQCLQDGFYTVRYRERNRKWLYQTCPTSDTVIHHLQPNVAYDFSVRANDRRRQSSSWSRTVTHTTGGKISQNALQLMNPLKPLFPPRPALLNRTRLPPLGVPRTNFVNAPRHRGFSPPHPALWSRPRAGSPARPLVHHQTNMVSKPDQSDKLDLKQTDKSLKSKLHPAPTPKPTKRPERRITVATAPTTAAPRQKTWEESVQFRPEPESDVDALGKKRFVAPHVVYRTGKKPDEPCSITSSLSFFPTSGQAVDANVTAPPRAPPSNITVVTVEGCPSFVILDWEKTDNDTTEYEVISTTKGPDGDQVSVLTTDQTHTTVENLRPESSYEFKVKPKNDLGSGPSSEAVSFNTESADPRVSENVSGKDAIWTQFPFKADSFSDCHGKQFVKRTWYKKFVGVQLCNSLRYKIYLSDSLTGTFHNIGDQSGFGEDHCQFVDSFLDGRTGRQLQADQLPSRSGFFRAVRQEPVHFGLIGQDSHINYVSWYECGTPIPGKW